MTSKKLGALLRSVPPATAPAELEEPAPPTRELAQIHPSEPRSSAARVAVGPEVPLQVLVPEHIRKQLGIKAAEEGKSLRALVLTAIRSLGISVTDEEIRDKRGRRHL
jgi:hypothetical protein